MLYSMFANHQGRQTATNKTRQLQLQATAKRFLFDFDLDLEGQHTFTSLWFQRKVT